MSDSTREFCNMSDSSPMFCNVSDSNAEGTKAEGMLRTAFKRQKPHTRKHTHTNTQTHTHTHARTHTHERTHVHARAHIYTHFFLTCEVFNDYLRNGTAVLLFGQSLF